MSLLERCCKCLGNGRKDVCNPKALLNQGQFKNVDKEYFVLPLLPSCSFFSSLLCPQADTTNTSNLVDTVVSVAQLRQGHSMFPLASTSSIHQHRNSCPSESEQLQSSWAGGSAARAAAPPGCVLYLSGIGAVGITTLYEFFWISYALLGSEDIS